MLVDCSHTHLQHVREAVSEVYARAQERIHKAELTAALPSAVLHFTEVSTDETEQAMQFEGLQGPENLLMLHGKTGIQHTTDTALKTKDYVTAPAVLHNTTTDTIQKAVLNRLQHIIWPPLAFLSVFVLNSDSATQMKAMARRFGQLATTTKWFLHSFCGMHMLATACASATQALIQRALGRLQSGW